MAAHPEIPPMSNPSDSATTLDRQGIILAGASVRLGGQLVLDRLSLALTEARIGILGRNGSGKTTLLRLIAGLIPADAGTVRVDGADPFKDRKAALRTLGILFQNPDHQILFPTVEEELAFGLVQQGMSRPTALAQVHAALAAEGLASWAPVAVSTLSQGQRQLLCLMAILLMAPDTILLDEPLSGLDLPTQARLTRRLAGLKQRLVTITHDPSALAGADRVIWLDRGRIAADGRPEEVIPDFIAAMDRIGAQDADPHPGR
jgi:biotin transport system ATP-binding protein